MKAKLEEMSVFMEPAAFKKILGWCRAGAEKGTEVSGLGLVKKTEDGFHIYDTFLLKQKGGAAHTELDQDDILRLSRELHKKGVPLDRLRYWWHTHPKMAAFWSGTDDNTATDMATGGGTGQPVDWWVSMVLNEKAQLYCRADFYKPFRATVDDLSVYFVEQPTESEIVEYGKDVDGKVDKAPLFDLGYGRHGGHWSGRTWKEHWHEWEDWAPTKEPGKERPGPATPLSILVDRFKPGGSIVQQLVSDDQLKRAIKLSRAAPMGVAWHEYAESIGFRRSQSRGFWYLVGTAKDDKGEGNKDMPPGDAEGTYGF